jgi:hypothetical protein
MKDFNSLEEHIGPAYLDLINQYINDESKEACSLLNSIRSHVGGGWNESCFCSTRERRQFITEFNKWFEEIKKFYEDKKL